MIGKNKEKLEIETLPVEIKVIRVGGHKMTKAVFNQIIETDRIPFDWAGDKPCPDDITPLGWVNTNGYCYILWVDFRGLVKNKLAFMQEIPEGGGSYEIKFDAEHTEFCINCGKPDKLRIPQLFIAT